MLQADGPSNDLTLHRDHQFNLLTEQLPVMVANCDRELRFKYVNNAYVERFGMTREEIIGKTAVEIIGAPAVAAIMPYVERVFAGERLEYETWVPYRTLGRRYMHCYYSPEIGANGDVIGYIAGIIDETARKNAEDALAASRARFDFLATSADVGVWSCDLPFEHLIWNAACKAHFGLPPDAAVTINTFYDRMHPDDVETTRSAIDRSVQEARPYDVEYRTRQQDGSYRWIRAVGRADYDRTGAARRFEGVTVDITAAKRANDAFRELADAMPQIVWSADASGRVDYFNRRWYELTGKAPGDLSVDGVVHPDDRDAARRNFQESVASETPYQHEYRLQLPGYTEPRWFLGRALPVKDERGRVLRWYATSTDIHERKQIESALVDSRDRLRAALDASGTGTFRWDIDSNELDWDDNLDRLFGLAPGSTARSLPEFLRLVHADDRQRVIDACARCAAESVDFVEEFRVIWPDGTVRWLFDKGRVFVNADGSRYMSGACVDVTERRNQEDALRAADRQKDEFLGMLAHEIRNPLAPMIYSVNVLQKRIVDAELMQPLDVIARQSGRMTRIVDDLLDVSRVTQGKIALQRQRVSVAKLLMHAVDALSPIAQARRHTLVLGDLDAAVTVIGDEMRLAQVVENLLVNAAKYTPDGGRIEVTAEREGDHVAIAVSDTGIGMAAHVVASVFDLFVQADTSLDRAEGGLGIGLTLADRLVRLHGGTLTAYSAGLGHGSTFTVRLPLAVAVAEPDATPLLTTGARRVLIVDDNVDSAQMLAIVLQLDGHDVQTVHDGAHAVQVFASFAPQLVLLDIGLPGRDGYRVVQDLRELPNPSAARIVAMTGYGRPEDRARCLSEGFDDHVTKPVDLTVLNRLLAAPAAQSA